MLPPFIIEQIRRREAEERQRREVQRPRLELPIDLYRPASEADRGDDLADGPSSEEAGRGVVVIDL